MTKAEKKKIVACLRNNEANCKADAAISLRRAAELLANNADRDEVWSEILDGITSLGEATGHANAAADVEEGAWK